MNLIAFLLLLPAIAAYSISQLAMHRKIKWWPVKDLAFWGDQSWARKYKMDSNENFISAPNTWYYRFFKIKYKERFPLSATALVNFTDGYHLSQSVMFLCLAGSFSIASSLNFFLVWGGILFVHFVTYKLLQRCN